MAIKSNFPKRDVVRQATLSVRPSSPYFDPRLPLDTSPMLIGQHLVLRNQLRGTRMTVYTIMSGHDVLRRLLSMPCLEDCDAALSRAKVRNQVKTAIANAKKPKSKALRVRACEGASMSDDLQLLPEIVTGNVKAAAAAAGGKSADLWMMPLEHVHYDPLDNVRPLNRERVAEMAKLMLANGFDKSHPLACVVKKIDGKDLMYVYGGQHRYHAAKLAKELGAAIKVVPCVAMGSTKVSRRNVIIAGVNGNAHEKLSPFDLAGAVLELKRDGMKHAEIATAFNITEQTIRDVLVLATAPAELQAMITRGEIKSTLAITEIREHGADKALQRFEKTLAAAQESGKTKITKKDIAKTATIDPSLYVHPIRVTKVSRALRPIDTIAPCFANAYSALRDVYSSPNYQGLSFQVRDAVEAALAAAPAGHGLNIAESGLGRCVDTPNENGVFGECERIKIKGKGAKGDQP